MIFKMTNHPYAIKQLGQFKKILFLLYSQKPVQIFEVPFCESQKYQNCLF